MMEWNKQLEQQFHPDQQNYQNGGSGGGGDRMYVQVMTDEQMELLRRQISVYATLCEQLVDMHKAVSTQQDFAGMKLGNLYCDPLVSYAGHNISARNRWTPTPLQLHILEHIFDEDNSIPRKEKIQEITTELSQHGQISEANVYNWFQNRRARSKRKLLVVAPNNAEVESSKEKTTEPERTKSHDNLAPGPENVNFQDSGSLSYLETKSNKEKPVFQSDHGLKSSGSLGYSDLHEGAPRTEQLMDSMDLPGSFISHQHGGGYDILG
ncbi:unnamed protein product [Ilex paraguariensis]|uniref:Homeobox domain-containing protein n=1 Tax=Ilex paraguariensis TaxID=185542 RepID=A0ABC8U986_9AQUA